MKPEYVILAMHVSVLSLISRLNFETAQVIPAPYLDDFSLLVLHRALSISGATKVRRNTILIVGVVVVGITVGVHNAEVVGVARIRRSLPPIDSNFFRSHP